jgi:hypothetical protein
VATGGTGRRGEGGLGVWRGRRREGRGGRGRGRALCCGPRTCGRRSRAQRQQQGGAQRRASCGRRGWGQGVRRGQGVGAGPAAGHPQTGRRCGAWGSWRSAASSPGARIRRGVGGARCKEGCRGRAGGGRGRRAGPARRAGRGAAAQRRRRRAREAAPPRLRRPGAVPAAGRGISGSLPLLCGPARPWRGPLPRTQKVFGPATGSPGPQERNGLREAPLLTYARGGSAQRAEAGGDPDHPGAGLLVRFLRLFDVGMKAAGCALSSGQAGHPLYRRPARRATRDLAATSPTPSRRAGAARARRARDPCPPPPPPPPRPPPPPAARRPSRRPVALQALAGGNRAGRGHIHCQRGTTCGPIRARRARLAPSGASSAATAAAVAVGAWP